MGLTRKGIVDQKPQFIPTLSLIIQNNSKVMFNTHVILFQYMTKVFCFNQWQEHKSIKISLNRHGEVLVCFDYHSILQVFGELPQSCISQHSTDGE